VHVPVDEARRHHHVARVDHAVGRRAGQLGGLAHAGDAAVVDQDRAVLDDAAPGIERHDVAGVVDLQGWHGRHGNASAGPSLATHDPRGVSSPA
jgi:hypothetical protein